MGSPVLNDTLPRENVRPTAVSPHRLRVDADRSVPSGIRGRSSPEGQLIPEDNSCDGGICFRQLGMFVSPSRSIN